MVSRIEQAVAAFEEGYNCAQAVFSTYADLFGIDRDTALQMTSTMGGGIGRMREVCGTVTSMELLAGLAEGCTVTDPEERERVYVLARKLADRFQEENGSIICRELLGILGREKSARPSERTAEYYASRPCCKFVVSAATLIEEVLLENGFAGEG